MVVKKKDSIALMVKKYLTNWKLQLNYLSWNLPKMTTSQLNHKIEEFAIIYQTASWIGELRFGEIITTTPNWRTSYEHFF